jgi:hypothetical protein
LHRISADGNLDRYVLDSDELSGLGFYSDLNRHLPRFLDRLGYLSGGLSYLVWGGVAVNLVLQALGLCKKYYSLHDVEMMLVGGDGRICYSDDLLLDLNSLLANTAGLPLVVGGIPIWRQYSGLPLATFSLNRVHLRDGDLDINRLALVVEDAGRLVTIEDPSACMRALVRGDRTIAMVEASDLQSVEQLARRVYRTISKAIRFDIVAQLGLAALSQDLLRQIILRFMDRVSAGIRGEHAERCLSPSERAWLSRNAIADRSSAGNWLAKRTLIETTIRTAGIYGVSSTDREGFLAFFRGELPCSETVVGHSLLGLLKMEIGAVSTVLHEDGNVGAEAYAAFVKHQLPGAEALCRMYSRHDPGGR